jgi:hypothetical protein
MGNLRGGGVLRVTTCRQVLCLQNLRVSVHVVSLLGAGFVHEKCTAMAMFAWSINEVAKYMAAVGSWFYCLCVISAAGTVQHMCCAAGEWIAAFVSGSAHCIRLVWLCAYLCYRTVLFTFVLFAVRRAAAQQGTAASCCECESEAGGH